MRFPCVRPAGGGTPPPWDDDALFRTQIIPTMSLPIYPEIEGVWKVPARGFRRVSQIVRLRCHGPLSLFAIEEEF
jgi:hypothetical protein